jgi:hypothetical protein
LSLKLGDSFQVDVLVHAFLSLLLLGSCRMLPFGILGPFILVVGLPNDSRLYSHAVAASAAAATTEAQNE